MDTILTPTVLPNCDLVEAEGGGGCTRFVWVVPTSMTSMLICIARIKEGPGRQVEYEHEVTN